LPLANFGTVTFTGAKTTISGTTGAIDDAAYSSGVNQINMVTKRGALEDSTSALTDSGSPTTSSFQVTAVVQTTSSHHGGKPVKAPDSAVAFAINTLGANNGSTIVANLQSSAPSIAPGPQQPPTVQIGYGLPRFEFYMLGDATDQSNADQDIDGGDAKPLVPSAPAQSSPAMPVQPRHEAHPPVGGGQMAGTEQARWLAAIDAVFISDFAAHQNDLPGPPMWTGLSVHDERTLAVALVLAGAVLAFQKEIVFTKDSSAKKNRRLQVVTT
jgi:hypothetical protein